MEVGALSMRLFAMLVAVAGCLLASPGHAGIDVVFGNTIVSRYPDGGWVKHWFNRDGSYLARFSDGRELRARWAVNGDRVCLNHATRWAVASRMFSSRVGRARMPSAAAGNPAG